MKSLSTQKQTQRFVGWIMGLKVQQCQYKRVSLCTGWSYWIVDWQGVWGKEGVNSGWDFISYLRVWGIWQGRKGHALW